MDLYLRVSLTTARLDMEGNTARMDLRQPHPRLTVQRHPNTASVESEHPRIDIDGTGAQAMEGRQAVTELTAGAARQGLADAHTAAEQYNAEGAAVVDGLAAGRLARANAAGRHWAPSDWGIGYMPYELPHIDFSDNMFHYSREPDQLTYDWEVHPTAEAEVTRQAGMHTRVAREGSVQIELAHLDTRA